MEPLGVTGVSLHTANILALARRFGGKIDHVDFGASKYNSCEKLNLGVRVECVRGVLQVK